MTLEVLKGPAQVFPRLSLKLSLSGVFLIFGLALRVWGMTHTELNGPSPHFLQRHIISPDGRTAEVARPEPLGSGVTVSSLSAFYTPVTKSSPS